MAPSEDDTWHSTAGGLYTVPDRWWPMYSARPLVAYVQCQTAGGLYTVPTAGGLCTVSDRWWPMYSVRRGWIGWGRGHGLEWLGPGFRA
eukprot:312713-Chlamydomonas_euryale.AAC.2